jgi:hypothetical protein
MRGWSEMLEKKGMKKGIDSQPLIDSGVLFSKDRKHRFKLWRIWDDTKPNCLFVLHNPSTADETKNDPTIRRCIQFAKSWGFGGVYIGNYFSFRSTDPKGLLGKTFEEIAPLENIRHIYEMKAECDMHVLAYGNFAVKDVEPMIVDDCWHYLKLTKAGNPCHPLYLKGDLVPIKFSDGEK